MILSFERGQGRPAAKQPPALPNKAFNDRDSLAAAPVVESYLFCLCWQDLAERENSLRQRSPDPVGIGILDPLAEAIGTRVNALSFERVSLQHERVPALVKARVGTEIEARYLPEPLFKAIKVIPAADADLFDNFLVEIVQELLPRRFSFVVNFRLKIVLELVKFEADLLRGSALLINRDDALLEVHARFNRAQHLVAGPEHAVEQAELFVKKLINPYVSSIAPVEEVDDHDIELLAVPVAPANALFDALRVPWQVIVDDQVAELQVDPLGGCFGGDHDGRVVPEIFHKRGPLVGRRRIRDVVRGGIAFHPPLINLFRFRISVGAVEENDLARKLGLLKNLVQILLRASGFRENESFLLNRRNTLAFLGLLGGGESTS